MKSKTFKKLWDLNSVMQSKKIQLIDTFVEFYGEENREDITQKFSKVIYCPYVDPRDLKDILYESDFTVYTAFLNHMNLKDSLKNRLAFLGYDYQRGKHNFRFDAFIKCINGDLTCLEDTVNFLNNFYPQVTKENFRQLYQDGLFNKLESFIYTYKQIKLDDFIYELYDEANELYEQLESESYYRLISENKNLFPEKEINLFFKNCKCFDKIVATRLVKNGSLLHLWAYLGDSLASIPLVELAHSSSANNLIKTGSEKEKSAIYKYQKQFSEEVLNVDYDLSKKSGFSLSPVVIDNFLEKKYEQLDLVNQDFFLKLDKKVLKHNSKLKNIPQKFHCSYDEYSTTIGFYTSEKDTLIVRLKAFNDEEDLPFLDKDIIHELNHLYEGYQNTSGWNINQFYKAINELVNEVLSEQISTLFHQKGYYMYSEDYNDKGQNSVYDMYYFLIKDFVLYFYEDIVKSRKNGNIDHIFAVVGKENFDNLASLVNEVEDKFTTREIVKVQSDFEEGIENPKALEYLELLTQKEQIIEQMLEYRRNLNKKNSL